MMRATYGVTASTSVSVGRIIASGCCHGRPPGGISVIAGSTWKTVVANSTTSATPTTNSGSAAKTSVINDVATSNGRARQTSADAPVRLERGIEANQAEKTKKAV